jgi:2,5-diketo-D-gluconate reductase A
MNDSHRLPLLHGGEIPAIGLGTWPYVGTECRQMVTEALDLGYRLLDTSHQYGNEGAVGAAVRSSCVPREEIFVTSKFNKQDHSVHGVRRAYEESLRRTGLEYLDLFLIHWPVPALDRYAAAWQGLVDLRKAGVVGAIGVSNFKAPHLERIISATGYVPDVNQIQLSVDLARTRIRQVHQSLGIVTEGWSPIGRGGALREDAVVGGIAAELGRTPVQVLLRWQIEVGAIPIPRASNATQLRQNIEVFDFNLTSEHLIRLARLDLGESAARDSDDPANGH